MNVSLVFLYLSLQGKKQGINVIKCDKKARLDLKKHLLEKKNHQDEYYGEPVSGCKDEGHQM